MKVRMVISQNCMVCRDVMQRWNKQSFDYETYDADRPEHQKQLDAWGITDFPVVQIISDDGSEILDKFPPGGVSVRFIKHRMAQLEEKK